MKNNKHFKYLKAIGIEVWELKDFPELSQIADESNSLLSTEPFTEEKWQKLEQKVQQCTLCGLDKSRTRIVFGTGDPQASLLIIGEAPGANEDRQGEPFVGRAGILLNAMLHAIGLKRNNIYIANILKCRPPKNRDPLPREVECCSPYLQQQIALIQPKIIVAVGRIAAHFLLNTKESLGRLRGRTYHYGENSIPLIVTFHPAYLLRSPKEKGKAYTDMLSIKGLLQTELSER